MASCLVTGGAGFIGSHLVDALLAGGHRVRVLDNFSTGSRENLAQAAGRIEVIEGDIGNLETVRRATTGVELVFHQAALPSVPRSVADPAATHDACATGTLHVLMAAREAKARRVIYAASSSAYGHGAGTPKKESDAPRPLSPYAVAKLAGEQYCGAFTEVYGLETVCLRYFNIFGPRQQPGGPYSAVIPLFIDAMLSGRSPVIFGDGLQSRDFTYVANAVRANLLAATAPDVAGKVYNVACGESTTLLQLVEHLEVILGTTVAPVHAPRRAGDVLHSRADMTRSRAELGLETVVDLREGLRLCVEHHRAARAGTATRPAKAVATLA